MTMRYPQLACLLAFFIALAASFACGGGDDDDDSTNSDTPITRDQAKSYCELFLMCAPGFTMPDSDEDAASVIEQCVDTIVDDGDDVEDVDDCWLTCLEQESCSKFLECHDSHCYTNLQESSGPVR
ncbi:MAG: hypothetical protein H6684_13755 [Deltaproteobacteria bacterium]|nr:hypothetical protein [bacterium]MCB9476943.1 hypothetical protein [Deltaproteobacteria bacterium]MCB9478677.1 hypothetical protein [Deltaproteobacteria bacterium]MCB9489793.1 hypothetical protein [Deltaproteobacteria bacterium]